MPINYQSTLFTPSGNPILTKSSIKYLGAQLSSDTKIDSEVSQKIGNAKRDFKILNSIWKHSNLTCKFKFQIYIACILQRLLYGLAPPCIVLESRLTKCGKRAARLGGGHSLLA